MQNHATKVLLVEDDEDDYVLTQTLFAEIRDGVFEVEWVKTYEDALERIAQNQHDVYLVDYRLGKYSGLELLQASIATCTAPMILLTGQGDHDVDLAAMKAGAADYLVKGEINAAVLERSIRYAIDRTLTLERLRQAVQEKSQLASAIANITTGVVITDPTQPDNPIVFVNPGFTRMTGYTLAEVRGCNCRFLQGSVTDPTVLQDIREAIASQRPYTGVLLNYRKDGSLFWNELTISPVFDPHGNLTSYIGLQNDVTARKQVEESRRESEERYALAVQGANDGIWDWNLKTSEVYFSSRWKSMLGHTEAEISNLPEEWFNRIHPEDLDWVKVKVSAHLDGLTPHFENEHRMRHRDGSYRWMLTRGLAVRDVTGRATRMAGSQTDITARKQAEEQLMYDALHDALTRLPNRTLLMDRLRHAIQLAKRTEEFLFAVLFLDVDRFKVINDSLGHMIGDQLLIAIAQRLSECLRPADTVARLGGDEFVILLEDIKDVNQVTAIAERIQQALTQPFTLEGHEVFTTVSIGIALSVVGYTLPEDLLRDADIAMYRAKAQGRARYEIFDTGMYTYAVALLQLETDLRWAVDREEFELHYQPIVALKNNRISGFEALVRWRHPTRGMVSPAEFISSAEETGLIIPLGKWVLREACRQMQVWHTQFPQLLPLSISVNISSKQFTPDLIEQIRQILEETGLSPKCLKLEITESILMENTESASTMLTQIQALGIQLSMDDFGTGYSSLSYLHRFPIDTLKIDRSFINKIDIDGEQLAIVRTIITLAWNLGMDVVAEGVETQKQLAQLRALQCEYGQGYFFSKPLLGEAAAQLLTSTFPLGRLNSIASLS
jgi:diguanylate cyclase (GGDEF)-like protein/PAS domain S-box-containing protein